MSPNFSLIAEILGDYHDLQTEGVVAVENRHPLAVVEEQIRLLGLFEQTAESAVKNLFELNEFCQRTGIGSVGDSVAKSVKLHIEKLETERRTEAEKLANLISKVRENLSAISLEAESSLTDGICSPSALSRAVREANDALAQCAAFTVMKCPSCNGGGKTRGHINTGMDSSKHRWEEVHCFRCGGAGVLNGDWVVRGQALRSKRVSLGMTLLEASVRLGVGPAAVSSMELGKSEPVSAADLERRK